MIRTLRLLALAVLAVPVVAFAAPVSVKNLRLWQAPDNTRLVFDLSAPLEHRLSTLSDPERIVIEMNNARLKDGLASLDVSRSYISAVRAAEQPDGKLRITLELKRPVRPKSFVLRPAGQYGHRLVIDLYDEAVAKAMPEPEPRAAPPVRQVLAPSDLVVAIDAGHGGEDPGAIGKRWHTREKDVVLAIARELYKLVAATPGMKPVMIRDGDYYVGLRERVAKANRHDADVFISIHADSVPGRKQARGSSVYALSDRGATSEMAKALADSENSSDWIGGIGAKEAGSDVRRLLGDLVKTATIGDSLNLGSDVLGNLRNVGPLHSNKVGQAGFMVLKSPIPSLLVETAFISSSEGEANLRDKNYQRRMAEAIYQGLKRAAPRLIASRGTGGTSLQAATPPPSLPVAPAPQNAQAVVASTAREHVVKPGETLSAIARLYDIHVETLRFLNGIEGSDLAVGTKLLVPAHSSEL